MKFWRFGDPRILEIWRIWAFGVLRILVIWRYEDSKDWNIWKFREFWGFGDFRMRILCSVHLSIVICKFWGFKCFGDFKDFLFWRFDDLRILRTWRFEYLEDFVFWAFKYFEDLVICRFWGFNDLRMIFLRIWWFEVFDNLLIGDFEDLMISRIWWFWGFGVLKIWWFTDFEDLVFRGFEDLICGFWGFLRHLNIWRI